jgi:hypothetical protein
MSNTQFACRRTTSTALASTLPWVVIVTLLALSGEFNVPTMPTLSLITAACAQTALNAMGDISWSNRKCWSAAVNIRGAALFWAVMTSMGALPNSNSIQTGLLLFMLVSIAAGLVAAPVYSIAVQVICSHRFKSIYSQIKNKQHLRTTYLEEGYGRDAKR